MADLAEEEFVVDDPYPSEDDPLPEIPAVDEAGNDPDSDGSGAPALWHGLLGTFIGLLAPPAGASALHLLLMRWSTPGHTPFALWGGGLLLLCIAQIWLYVFLQRRVSTMCAISYGVCAFFCLIPDVAILSQASSLQLPL